MGFDMLELINVEASYATKPVLRGISLSASRAERLLLVGPNGAGKSTVLKVVAGLLHPAAGIIKFEGKNIVHLSTYKRMNDGIGYLLQSSNIVPGLTVEDNLLLAVIH